MSNKRIPLPEEFFGFVPGSDGHMIHWDKLCEYYYLLDDIGVKVDYCDSEQLNHIWNLVYINNVPYHVDVTWDDIAWGNGQRGAEGAVNHDNFLRSTSGIVSTGHNGTDYDTTPNSSVYDNYFWQNSSTEFQLIGNEIYYIDNVSETLERLSELMIRRIFVKSCISSKSIITFIHSPCACCF